MHSRGGDVGTRFEAFEQRRPTLCATAAARSQPDAPPCSRVHCQNCLSAALCCCCGGVVANAAAGAALSIRAARSLLSPSPPSAAAAVCWVRCHCEWLPLRPAPIRDAMRHVCAGSLPLSRHWCMRCELRSESSNAPTRHALSHPLCDATRHSPPLCVFRIPSRPAHPSAARRCCCCCCCCCCCRRRCIAMLARTALVSSRCAGYRCLQHQARQGCDHPGWPLRRPQGHRRQGVR